AALVMADDRVFPHFVAGGGWQTTLTLVNMSPVPQEFTIDFYTDDGQPLVIPIPTVGGTIQRMTSAQAVMPAFSTRSYSTADIDAVASSGWALLTYDASKGRIGGYGVFRQRVAGRPDFEG